MIELVCITQHDVPQLDVVVLLTRRIKPKRRALAQHTTAPNKAIAIPPNLPGVQARALMMQGVQPETKEAQLK
jgi:hypothetical protein